MAQARKVGLGKGIDSLIPMGMELGGIQKSDQKSKKEGLNNGNYVIRDEEAG